MLLRIGFVITLTNTLSFCTGNQRSLPLWMMGHQERDPVGGVSFATGSGPSLSLAGGGGFGFGGGGGTKFWLRVQPYRMSRGIICQIDCLPAYSICRRSRAKPAEILDEYIWAKTSDKLSNHRNVREFNRLNVPRA